MKIFFLLMMGFLVFGCGAGKQSVTDSGDKPYFILNPSIRILDFDPLENLYVLDGTDRLSKFDTTGKLLCHVINNNLGEAHSLDTGNPFKIMVFYRDQQTVVLYDRTLSEIQRIRLTDWGLHDVSAACLSPDNAIWVFEGSNRLLMKMNDQGAPILTSDPFDVTQPGTPRPDYIYDTDHFLILKETSHGVSVFDDFGSYLYTTNFEADDVVSISNNLLLMVSGRAVWNFDISSRQIMGPILVNENIEGKQVYLFANQVFIVDNKGVYNVYP